MLGRLQVHGLVLRACSGQTTICSELLPAAGVPASHALYIFKKPKKSCATSFQQLANCSASFPFPLQYSDHRFSWSTKPTRIPERALRSPVCTKIFRLTLNFLTLHSQYCYCDPDYPMVMITDLRGNDISQPAYVVFCSLGFTRSTYEHSGGNSDARTFRTHHNC